MACQTCDHTMHLVFMDADRTIHICPRCGTYKSVLFGHADVVVPKLVERVRVLYRHTAEDRGVHPGAEQLLGIFHLLGITESVHTPDKRG